MKQLHGNHAKLYTTCCPSCAHQTKEYKDKHRHTMESRYGKGITNPMQIKEFVDKIQETDRRNHGGILFNQTKEGRKIIKDRWQNLSIDEKNKVIQKAIDSNKRNHGGVHSSSLEETKNKYRVTISKRTQEDWDNMLKKSIEKWEQHYGKGITNPSQAPEVKEAVRQTCMRKFNAPTYFSSEDKKIKSHATNKEKYGNEEYSRTEECKEKVRRTGRIKWGKDYYVQTDEYKQRIPEIRRRATKKWVLFWNDDNTYVSTRYDTEEYNVNVRKWQHELQMDSSWEIELFVFCKLKNGLDVDYQPNLTIPYEYDGKTHSYHPDFIINGRIVEVKGDNFFRINESTGKEEMYCTWRNPKWSDEYYEWRCGREEAKHQCMIANNVVILRHNDLSNLNINLFQ